MMRIRCSIPSLILGIALAIGVAPSSAIAQSPVTSPATTSAPPPLTPTPPTTSASTSPAGAVSEPRASALSPAAGSVFGILPGEFSPWGMFLSADIVVKGVICLLAFAVVLTWTIWLAKCLELAVARRRLRQAFWGLRAARSLDQAAEVLGTGNGVARTLLRAAQEEWHASADALDDREGLKERIALHLERVEAATGRRMMVGTGVLATTGSTAPFVGLFGTVWGIMNSFIGISRMHTTNLAVVAPGIAEALLATAIGLVAAIPAVIIYNHFVRQIGAYKALVADAASAVMRLASRDLSRRGGNAAGPRPLRVVAE